MVNTTNCLLNTSGSIPYPTTQHGNERILCIYGPAWKTALSIITFFATNYVAHAATVKSSPGDGPIASITNIVLALMFPMSGFMRSINAIARCAIRGRTELGKACLAGALCMVVRKSGWKPADGQTIEAVLLRKDGPALADDTLESGELSTNLSTSHEAEPLHMVVRTFCPPYVREDSSAWAFFDSIGAQMYVDVNTKRIHGTFSLPDGYAFAIVPRNTRLEMTFGRDRRPSALASQPPQPRSDITSSYNVAKALASLVQTLAAFGALLGHRDDLIDRWGYASFHLTVLPYLVMTLFNFVGNTVTPDYPCMYMVESSTMEEAKDRGGLFVGTVATTRRLGIPHEVSRTDLEGWEGLRGMHLQNLLVPKYPMASLGLPGAYAPILHWIALLVLSATSNITSRFWKLRRQGEENVSVTRVTIHYKAPPQRPYLISSPDGSSSHGPGLASEPCLSIPAAARTHSADTMSLLDHAQPEITSFPEGHTGPIPSSDADPHVFLNLDPCHCNVCGSNYTFLDIGRQHPALLADPATGDWALLLQSMSNKADKLDVASQKFSLLAGVTMLGGGEFLRLNDVLVNVFNCYKTYLDRIKVAKNWKETVWALVQFELDLLKAVTLPPDKAGPNPNDQSKTLTVFIPICSRFERNDDFSKRNLLPIAAIPGFEHLTAPFTSPRAKTRGSPASMMAVEACVGLLAMGLIMLLIAYFSHWFSAGQSSRIEKIIMLLWMCEGTFGMLFAMAGLKEILLILVLMPVYIVVFAHDNPMSGLMYILWFASLATFVPPVWGFVLVGKMLVEWGQCVALY